MLDSSRTIPHGHTLDFDVCIVGAGAAGITLALELDGSPLKTCLLEAGGLEAPTIDPDHPYAGENVGRPYSLTSTRLRYFGGTTNHWGGWCRPLDEIDFLPRPFVPLSGWPISRSALDPYYLRAQAVCEISPSGFDVPQAFAATHFDLPDLTIKMFRFSPPTRFGVRYRSQVQRSSNVACLLNSTVVEIDRPKRLATRLRVVDGAKEFFVRAAVFILASGAIENARLLLDSTRHDPRGVGNETDFVGRCFSDHVGFVAGRVLAPSSSPYRRTTREGIEFLPHLSFVDEVLLANRLINFGAILLPTRRAELVTSRFLRDRSLYRTSVTDWQLFNLLIRFEPTPNPESRVLLASVRDGNGARRVRLDWRPNDIEFHSVDKILELLARSLGSKNLGRVRRTFFDNPEWRNTGTYGAHQLGTTRMSSTPATGVVDENCRIHSADNLFVAGSSVFPTFGFANPTLTITALAIRLADHLKTTVPARS